MVIHAAAERRPDVSEKDPEGTRRLNVEATRSLAQAAQKVGAWVLYLSTDYVFDGTTPPYKPGDQTHPLNFYGETKLEGEQALRGVLPDAGILRVGVLYGRVEYWGESAVTAVHREATSDKDVNVDDWGQRYPTFVDDVAVICRQLAERRLADGNLGGMWHWCGNERFTKYDMAKIMAELLGRPTTHLHADPNPPKGAPRPRDCRLDCSALETLGMGRRTPFRTAMAEILRGSAGSAQA